MVNRDEEFSPVKNAPGNPVDSPDSARAIFSAMSEAWLVSAGATLEGEGVAEVSPLVSYGGEGLVAFAGMTLSKPLLVKSEGEASEAELVGEGSVRSSVQE